MITFAIIVMTMSRSGLLNFGTLLVTFIFFRYVRSSLPIGSKFKEVSALVICAMIALGFVFTYTELTSASGGNSRLSRLLNNQRVDDGSAGTRLGAIVDCLEHIEAAPIIGHGTGFSRTMSELPHNIYLQQWVNNGILGIVSYIALLVTALATFIQRGCRNGQALIIVAVVGGLFSHNLLDQRPFLMLLGIMLGASVTSQPSRDNLLSLIPLHNAAKQRPLPEGFSASSRT